jgi:uncharacterized protein
LNARYLAIEAHRDGGEGAVSAIHSVQFLYTISGFAVGMLVGLTGVGGGALMTPLLILFFGINPTAAVGTDLLYAAVTKTAGSLVHGRNRTIDWRVVGLLATGSLPMTIAAIAALSALDINSAGARELINAVLTVALIVTAICLVLRDKIVARYSGSLEILTSRQTAIITIAVGAVLGLMVSISSVGAGAIGVTALVLLYPKFPTARIVGTDIAHAVPLALAAGLGHWLLGTINWEIFGSLILGSIPGIVIGSYAAVRIPDRALRFVLAATLLVVATKLSLGLLPAGPNVIAERSLH